MNKILMLVWQKSQPSVRSVSAKRTYLQLSCWDWAPAWLRFLSRVRSVLAKLVYLLLSCWDWAHAWLRFLSSVRSVSAKHVYLQLSYWSVKFSDWNICYCSSNAKINMLLLSVISYWIKSHERQKILLYTSSKRCYCRQWLDRYFSSSSIMWRCYQSFCSCKGHFSGGSIFNLTARQNQLYPFFLEFLFDHLPF